MSPAAFIQRTFKVDGQDTVCRFFVPTAADVDFECRYEIAWPEGVRSGIVPGVDSVQALLLAMQTAHIDLLASRENDGRQVTWLNQQSLGLPIAEVIRDWDSDGRL